MLASKLENNLLKTCMRNCAVVEAVSTPGGRQAGQWSRHSAGWAGSASCDVEATLNDSLPDVTMMLIVDYENEELFQDFFALP